MPTKTISIKPVPAFLQTWAFIDATGQEGGGSGSHICTALYTKNLLTKDELDTFSKLTFWGLKNREKFTQFYRSYFLKIMNRWSEGASNADWKELQNWAKRELVLIQSKNLETAFNLFVKKVVEINERVNSSLELYTAPELDCYLGAMKTVSVTA